MENRREYTHLVNILKALGKGLDGLKVSDGELFSLIIVQIVSLKARLNELEKRNKALTKNLARISQLDAFKAEYRRQQYEKK